MSGHAEAKNTSRNDAKENTLPHKLTREEREDFIQSLEHIVTVGSSIRRAAKRVEEWEKQRESKANHEADEEVINTDEDGEDIGAPRMMHAEDVRVFGKNGYPMNNWPPKSRRHKRKDGEWDEEHGDCINSLSFLEARLSDMPASKRQRVDGPNLSHDKTDCTISLEDVPRAMLARCWERAVHAASMGIECADRMEEEDEEEEAVSVSSPPTSNVTGTPPMDVIHIDYSYENAVRKCRNLNIHLKTTGVRQSCPQCGIVFSSKDDLRRHFFGNDNHFQRGCCWALIRTTQYRLLDEILQQEVTEAADGLIKSAISSADNTDQQEKQEAHDWVDVLSKLESTCSNAHVREDSTSTLQDTVLCEPQSGPITLNSLVLQNTKLRLIGRYANLPL